MSLTTGRGPLSAHSAGHFTPAIPVGVVYVEPFPRRVRAIAGGATVVDTEHALLVHRPGQPPIFAFPSAAVEGIASEPVPEAPDHVHVLWDAVEEWWEEDEQAFGHPRNPYHRVDCVRTSRRLVVEVNTTVLLDTTETVGVYETSLAPKLYVERDLVRPHFLLPSQTQTYCPYKGTASYWNAIVDGDVIEDAVWSYEDPLPECLPIAGLLSFDPTKVTVTQDLSATSSIPTAGSTVDGR